MEKGLSVTSAEWPVMELLWQSPRTLMELVNDLTERMGWSKSTITTMVRRMDDKGLISFRTEGRTKIFFPAVSREEVTSRETHSLLDRAFHGSVGLLVNAMAQSNRLTQADIDELYAILKEAEEGLQ